MAATTLYAVRQELVTEIVAQLVTNSVTGVTVTAYPPIGVEATREDRIWFEDIDATQTHLVYGGAREEELAIGGVVLAFKDGFSQTEQAEAELRARTIFKAVEDALRADSTVDGETFHGQIVTYRSVVNQGDEVGPIGRIEFTVATEAHI